MKLSELRAILAIYKRDKKFWNDVRRNEVITANIGRMLQDMQRYGEDFDEYSTEDKARLAASHGRHPYDYRSY